MVRVPPGFTRVFPYIMADDPDRLVQFLRDGLGGQPGRESRRDDGALANAMVTFGDTTVMVSGTTSDWPATRGTYYLYVDDADAAMARAEAAGGTCRMAVADQDYGDRQGGVADPEGNVWWLSQRLAEGAY